MRQERVVRVLRWCLGLGLGLGSLAPAPAWSQDRWRVDLEGAAAWQTRNQFRIPGTTGTLVSLEDYASGPFAAFRATLVWNVSERSSLRLLAAPLRLDVDFTPEAPIDFQGATFAAGQPTRARYEFDSYRLTWFYRFRSTGAWSFRAGVTAKVRDARIGLASGSLAAEKTNTGPVPLLYVGVRYSPSERFAIDLDVDALGAPQGYAVDLALRAEQRLGERASVFIGYRFLDGGADNDEVYTFATFHYATAGLSLRF
jgi:hypothetical protein